MSKKREQVILTVREQKRVTSADLGVSTAYLDSLARAEILKVAGKVNRPGRGRPANIYSMTRKGSGIALNLARKAQKASEPVAA